MALPTHISDATRRLNQHFFAAIEQNEREQRHKFGFIPDPTPEKKRIRQQSGETESQIQQRLIKWWALECVSRKIPEKLLMAFPLQGRRSASNGARMKAEGMRAGTPDLFLAVASQYDRETGATYHGLWIELKKPKGKLADSQKEMLQILDVQGYAAYATYGFDNAVKLITNYLNGEQFF